MLRRNVPVLTAVAMVLCAGIPAQSGFVEGDAGLAEFEAFRDNLGMTHVDFEGIGNGTWLPPFGSVPSIPSGLEFRSTRRAYDNRPIDNQVETANLSHHFGEIVGVPCSGCGDDGRVEYEVTFDTPQRAVGVMRTASSAITRFVDSSSALLVESGPQYGFVGYYADTDDPSQWIGKVEFRGEEGNPLYTDDLFFGNVIPEPASLALWGAGLLAVMAWRRRDR